MKLGRATSEFWLSMLVIVCATALAVVGKIDGNAWLVATGVQGAGYALSRGIAKN